jgi:glycosyltransferase involved in cell wall biosynthesis
MKIALVHEWLTNYAGSERVLEQMLLVFPEADVFATIDFVPNKERFFLQGKTVNTTFVQKVPFSRKKYRQLLPLALLAVEQHDLSGYDLIISSSHAVAKGVLTGPDQLHLCMCYSPIRYAWDLQHQYLAETGLDKGLKGYIAKWLLHKIRLWDLRTANGVDAFMAISCFIARRIWKVYRRESEVIYPPVDVHSFDFCEIKEDFYVTASRMVPYKRIDIIVEAFSKLPEKQLIVIGDGPDFIKTQQKTLPNIKMMGYQRTEIMKDYMQRAKAFIFAAEEDFGIAPLEAQACGTPVIAYGKGGALETIRGLGHAAPTGLFFSEQTADAVVDAVKHFELVQNKITPQACRDNALRFSPERFRDEFKGFVDKQMATFTEQKNVK